MQVKVTDESNLYNGEIGTVVDTVTFGQIKVYTLEVVRPNGLTVQTACNSNNVEFL